jgi:protein TonB
LAVDYNWIKYFLAALAIHVAILAMPVRERIDGAAGVSPIDVVVMLKEPPREPVSRRTEERKIERPKAPRRYALQGESTRLPARQPQPAEEPPKAPQKEEEASGKGAGNTIDETIVTQSPPAAAGDEGGVALAGVNPGGAKAGLGSGGASAGTGSGTTGRGAGSGPLDARFGDPDGPGFIRQERPEYPAAAERLRREGKVSLKLTIDERGNLRRVDVVEATDQMFAASAVTAMKRSRFRPAKRNNVAVPCTAPFTIRFGF